jgi:hypothetical protein
MIEIPQEIEILAILPFGYPVAALGKGRKKQKSLGEVAHCERWNQPYAEEVPQYRGSIEELQGGGYPPFEVKQHGICLFNDPTGAKTCLSLNTATSKARRHS